MNKSSKFKISFRLSVVVFLFAWLIYADNNQFCSYDFQLPDAVMILPEILDEISGVAIIDSNTAVCIQDEKGILFFYDLIARRIIRQILFGADGDYEGIACVNSDVYILKSDGVLFEIKNFKSEDFMVFSFKTGIPSKNSEALCYDLKNNRLLIAGKGKIRTDSSGSDKRAVYAFCLKSHTLSKEPVITTGLREIELFALNNSVDLKKHNGENRGNEPGLQFKISAIGIHPVTKELFIVSASDYLIVIVDESSAIKKIKNLEPKIFGKAEGISFFNNGDMLISNEGHERKPVILQFNCR